VHVVIGAGAGPRDGFDLGLAPSADGSTIEWRWATDVLDDATVRRMAAHLDRLVAAVTDDPDLRLSRVPLLSDAERRQLIVEWNDTARPFSDGATVHELVLSSAARTPDAVAAVGEDGRELQYRALEAHAHRLAQHLGAIGVRRGGLVGVHLERSVDMLVALQAVLEAGAAYVPLDPSFPPDRLALMVEDSGLTTLITQRSLEQALTVPAGVRRVVIDGDDAAAIAAASATRPAVTVDCRDLAYVIYTSGSTGRPKGVMLEHRSVVNFLESMAVEPGLDASDRLLAVTTLSFDIAGLELWLPLLVGGTVVIASRSTAADPQALAAALVEHRITAMQATPATWRMLVEAGWPGDPELEVLCGGEALPAALAASLAERAGEVWNMYGPTETTIWSTLQRVVPDAPVSIGRPIANTTLYVLDPAMQPVPIGVAGELFIGGDGLARGYHERPELTADRFVPDPFGGAVDARARLYRTGDLVRYRSDGRIEFLGRIDQQVKVRGFRIELGEIETVLGRNPAVEEAIVVARDDAHGDKRLVAYVTISADERSTVTASSMRRSVQDVLPHYMVPSVVVFLDAMPRTPNGKTDRKAMPEPDWSLIGRDVPYVAPRDDLETRMTALWERQIGLDGIGIDDNFFELGVESIVAARLFATIEREFGVELPIGTVFANPTVAQLSALVRDGRDDAAPRWPSLVPIRPDGDRVPIFGIHGGAGTVLGYSDLARRLSTAGHPFYGLAAQGLYTRAPVHSRVEGMAAAYLAQVRDVQPHGPYVFVGYCFGAFIALEMAHLARAAGEEVAIVVAINGTSKGYVARHRHEIYADDEEEVGALIATGAPAAPQRTDLTARIRRRLGLVVRRAQLRTAVALHRPLPEPLRQDRWFAWLAYFAELHYEPAPYDAPFAVFRVAALYDEPDLGWSETARGRLECFDVPGDQPHRRFTMKEPCVGFVAREIVALVDELAPHYNER
jgi:amino acid adenylation domain-containing protein